MRCYDHDLLRRAGVPRRPRQLRKDRANRVAHHRAHADASSRAMGDPQFAYPVIHVTGTNGKGSTSQMITRLLMAHGLTVGTYTSPHLERPNERMSRDCEFISDDEFAEQIAAVADLEMLTGVRPSYFEATTAAAFRWFADLAVDVAVIEVGVLGRWDATNVCDAQVAVITNIGMDHNEFAGPTKGHIAAEKAGVIKPGSIVVVGETDPELLPYFTDAGGETRAAARRTVRCAREPVGARWADGRSANTDDDLHRCVRAAARPASRRQCRRRTDGGRGLLRQPGRRRRRARRVRRTCAWPVASKCSAISRW